MEVAYIGKSTEIYTEFPEHHHGYWEIIYHQTGSGIFTANGIQYPFEPGDITIIPPGMIHKKESKYGFSDFCIFIKDFRPVGSSAFRILHDDEDQTVYQIMKLAKHYSNLDNVYEHAILNTLGDTLYHVLVYLYSNHETLDMRLNGIIDEMKNHINDSDFDLSSAIKDSGYCEGYFRKIFKEFTGQSPVNYMQQLRIDYAKSLLNQYGSSRSIKEIARCCGFNDQLYFSRVFKKLTGVSPKEYVQNQSYFDLDLISQGER